ncbi:hypothetical protein D0Z08_06955 [Nocardioides immobilis]|uniref:Ig-like domain-containing protein n=1 Tax=Nocardioides immobilis TaxID=2049295 RepID=A0A417Y5N6_9ACTN|nr:hypothetical protein [Nocardioides immobilis]RHW28012.1 hypothetical protein D0Z08_06955 [Nocardioides immobilis]
MLRRTRMLVLGTVGAVMLSALIAAPVAHAAAPGDLDLSFGTSGIAKLSFGSSAEGVVIQPNGRIVMVGSTGSQGQSDFAVARLDPDGTLDTSFSGDGRLVTEFGAAPAVATDVALQSDGDIVVVGATYGGTATSWNFAVAVYNPDGTRDTGFSANGLHVVDFDDDYDWAHAVAVQGDNKILLGGLARIGGDGDFGISRLTTSGALDTTFGGDGIVTTGFGDDETLADLDLQPDGKLVAVGDGKQGGDFDFLAARYNTSGSLDSGFHLDGKAVVGLGGNDIANAVAIQADGKIVAAGSRTTFPSGGTNVDFALARFHANGFLDSTFDGDGKLTEPLDGAQAHDVAIQANGRIVIAGQLNTTTPDAAIARYTSAGDLDTTFSNNGLQTVDLDVPGADHATSLAFDSDGKIVIAGDGSAGFAAARVHGFTDSPPQTTITSGPIGTTADATPTFYFSASETGSRFECQVDTGTYTPCTSPRTLATLGEGAHTFRVRAIDDSAQVDLTPATRTFTVDTAPNTTISIGPSGPTSDNTPTFWFSSSQPGSTFACAVDDGAYATCTSPHTTPVLSDGTHTFRVRATDADGAPDTDPTPAQRTFSVDTVPPDTVIDSAPSGTISDPTPTITFHGVEATTYACRVDTGTSTPCSSPWTTPPLGDGPHTVSVTGVDAVGNLDPSPATATFTVDVSPPDTQIDSGPVEWSRSATPTFTFSATEPATFECAFDGAAYATCTSPFAPATPLPEGPHSFSVRATDQFDHVDPTPADRAFTVDTVPPDTAIVSGPSGTITQTTAQFTFDTLGEAAHRFRCRLDQLDWEACTSPKTYAGLAEGDHIFWVRAYDAAGNRDSTPARRDFRVQS